MQRQLVSSRPDDALHEPWQGLCHSHNAALHKPLANGAAKVSQHDAVTELGERCCAVRASHVLANVIRKIDFR